MTRHSRLVVLLLVGLAIAGCTSLDQASGLHQLGSSNIDLSGLNGAAIPAGAVLGVFAVAAYIVCVAGGAVADVVLLIPSLIADDTLFGITRYLLRL